MRVTPVFAAAVFAALSLPGLAFAQTPAPSPSPSPSPAAAATASPAPADDDSDVPLVTGPARVSYEDGLRDGEQDGASAKLFGTPMPDPTTTTTVDYGRGYKHAWTQEVHRRRRNAAVIGGFVVLIVAAGAVAAAQSQSNKSGTIAPLFRF